jgi:YceI-like protein
MKFLKNLGLLTAVLLTGLACTTSTKSTNEEADEVCIYKYDNQSLDFKWTAYKFTGKKGVPGTFDEIAVTAAADATSIEDLLQSIKFNIKTNSVNSKEPVRDAKISEFFFGTMANTAEITGGIKSADDNKAVITLTINELTVDVPGTIEIIGDTIKLHSTVDFKEFGGQEAVAMLNQVCSEKHTGEDGKSVFWDVVDINVQAVYTKECK